MRLRRIAPGHYETHDGMWQIVQGQWIARSATNRHHYTDPIPTLREAREQLAAMVAAA